MISAATMQEAEYLSSHSSTLPNSASQQVLKVPLH